MARLVGFGFLLVAGSISLVDGGLFDNSINARYRRQGTIFNNLLDFEIYNMY